MFKNFICAVLIVFVVGIFIDGGIALPSYQSGQYQQKMSGKQNVIDQKAVGFYEPSFDPSTPQNVTALLGKTAFLSCKVRNLGNRTISWIRHRDIHILTVGTYTYATDQRFQAIHPKKSDEWTLQIKFAQKRDSGVYECQLSTQPVKSYFVNLNIVVASSFILGGSEMHVDTGSTINITCVIQYCPEPPAYIFWYHFDDVISYDSGREGVNVITEKGEVTTSCLIIQNAKEADAGKYSCTPSNADVATVQVHVLSDLSVTGDSPAAMQARATDVPRKFLRTLMFVFIAKTCTNLI